MLLHVWRGARGRRGKNRGPPLYEPASVIYLLLNYRHGWRDALHAVSQSRGCLNDSSGASPQNEGHAGLPPEAQDAGNGREIQQTRESH